MEHSIETWYDMTSAYWEADNEIIHTAHDTGVWDKEGGVEELIALCRDVAHRHNLTEYEYAWLLAANLSTWRGHGIRSGRLPAVPVNEAAGEASVLLDMAGEDHPLGWLTHHCSELLWGIVEGPILRILSEADPESSETATGESEEG